MFTMSFLSKCFMKATTRTVHLSRGFCKTLKFHLYEGTIFSLSSGYGKCGVAVVRVSGPASVHVLRKIGRFKHLPTARQAVLRRLADPHSGEMIDRGMVLFFPKPASFTGEDSVEFHVHGGPAVVSALLAAICKVPGCRQAEPGEFTKRAFLNGKFDLTEVEGLGDLIHAETEAQRRQALRQLDGELGQLYRRWTELLTKCLADIEAFIDFSEDQDIEETVVNEVNDKVHKLIGEISAHLDDNRRGERLRQGVQVAIIGEPNVGKSSLLNSLCQRSAAIVTPVAGTTRDVIETVVNIGGFPVALSDTAGLRQSDDVVEIEGIRRALDRYLKADLKILMIDSLSFCDNLSTNKNVQSSVKSYIHLLTSLTQLEDVGENPYCDSDRKDNISGENSHSGHIVQKDTSSSKPIDRIEEISMENIIVVLNKTDKLSEKEFKALHDHVHGMNYEFHVCLLSCLTNYGFTEFLGDLKMRVKDLCGDPLVGHPSLTQERHRDLINRCLQNLHKYRDQIEGCDIVLAAQCLRKALRCMGSITGKVTSDDILDVIFRDFCIGK